MSRNRDGGFRRRLAGRRGLGFVEETELIGGKFFAAPPEAFGEEEVDLFLKGGKPGLLALGLLGQSRDLAVFLREDGEELMNVRGAFEGLARHESLYHTILRKAL